MSPCHGCHAGCCRSYAVPVTGADILRIEAEQGIDFWEFVCRWADPDGQIARNYAPRFHFDDEPETPFTLCLMHTPSQTVPGTTKCIFLDEQPRDAEHPFGQAACGQYHSRPAACRAFPTKLDAAGELAIIQPITDEPRTHEHPVYSLCPRPWTKEDVDPVQAVQDLVVAQHEIEFFRKLSVAWNRRPGPWRLFPDFLRMVYSNRVREEHEGQHTVHRDDEQAA